LRIKNTEFTRVPAITIHSPDSGITSGFVATSSSELMVDVWNIGDKKVFNWMIDSDQIQFKIFASSS
jgi:hypothetical protein